MARDIDRKLRLTAALLGVVSRKDLAAAFRRVNPGTFFEIGRADKWLQGRSQPRELHVYEDWSKVLELDRPGQWVADCDIDAFLDAVCLRHGRNRDALLNGIEPSNGRDFGVPGSALELAGTFACYSNAWSPYFRGRVIRGELSIEGESSPNRLAVAYTEVLPTGAMTLKGLLHVTKRGLHIQVSDAKGEVQFLTFSLFQASPPASILAGLMFGTTVIGPNAEPSVTRIVMARVPEPAKRLRSADAYLPTQGSIAEDLAGLGLHIDDAATTDRLLAGFLSGVDGGLDQIPASAYHALTERFDRSWLAATR